MSGGRRFFLERRLGEGSFGTVYLADMVSLGGFRKRVALKVLNGRWTGDSDAGRRLRDEARVLGRLEHPNIVRVYDLVRVDGRWAVVMEAILGFDLEQLVARLAEDEASVPPRAALSIVATVADALDAALHQDFGEEGSLGVIHRDIKPSNLILMPNGTVKVLDFGICRSQMSSREASTSRIGFGSLPYMSPERLGGEQAHAEGDVYSLGVVLFELLLGESFGRSSFERSIADAHLDARLSALTEHLSAHEAPSGPSADRPSAQHGVDDDPTRSAEGSVEGIVALLRSMLAYDAAQRPTIGIVRARSLALAELTEGPELARFAADAVPRELLGEGYTGTIAHGVLSEESSSGGAVPEPRRTSGNPTLVASFPPTHDGQTVVQAPTFSVEAAPPSSRRRAWSLVGLAVAIGVLTVAGWSLDRPAASAEATNQEQAVADLGGDRLDATAGTATGSPVDQADPAPAAPRDGADPTTSRPPTGGAPTTDRGTAAPAAAEPAAHTRAAPDAVPDAVPEPAAAPERATAARRSSPGASSGTAEEAPPDGPATPAEPAATEPSPTVRMVKLVAPEATAVTARCGSRSGAGSTSLVVRDAPVGTCTVQVEADGDTFTTAIDVREPVAVRCTLAEGALSCS